MESGSGVPELHMVKLPSPLAETDLDCDRHHNGDDAHSKNEDHFLTSSSVDSDSPGSPGLFRWSPGRSSGNAPCPYQELKQGSVGRNVKFSLKL